MSLLKRIAGLWLRFWRARATHCELQQLSDSTLRDIGLRRDQLQGGDFPRR